MKTNKNNPTIATDNYEAEIAAKIAAYEVARQTAARVAEAAKNADQKKQKRREKTAEKIFGFNPFAAPVPVRRLWYKTDNADGTTNNRSDDPLTAAAVIAAIKKIVKLYEISGDPCLLKVINDIPVSVSYFNDRVNRYDYGTIKNADGVTVEAARRAALVCFHEYEAEVATARRDYRSGKKTIDEATATVRVFRRTELPTRYAETLKDKTVEVTTENLDRLKAKNNAEIFDYINEAAVALLKAVNRIKNDDETTEAAAARIDLFTEHSMTTTTTRNAENATLITATNDNGVNYCYLVNAEGKKIFGDYSNDGTTAARRRFTLVTPTEPTPFSYILRSRNKAHTHIETISCETFNKLTDDQKNEMFLAFSVIVKKKIQPYYLIETALTPYDEAKNAVVNFVGLNKSGTVKTPTPLTDYINDDDDENGDGLFKTIATIADEATAEAAVVGVANNTIADTTAEAATRADGINEINRLKQSLTPSAARVASLLAKGYKKSEAAAVLNISKAAISKQLKIIKTAASEIDYMNLQKTEAENAAIKKATEAKNEAEIAAAAARRAKAAILPTTDEKNANNPPVKIASDDDIKVMKIAAARIEKMIDFYAENIMLSRAARRAEATKRSNAAAARFANDNGIKRPTTPTTTEALIVATTEAATTEALIVATTAARRRCNSMLTKHGTTEAKKAKIVSVYEKCFAKIAARFGLTTTAAENKIRQKMTIINEAKTAARRRSEYDKNEAKTAARRRCQMELLQAKNDNDRRNALFNYGVSVGLFNTEAVNEAIKVGNNNAALKYYEKTAEAVFDNELLMFRIK